jgi:hypothetical protein
MVQVNAKIEINLMLELSIMKIQHAETVKHVMWSCKVVRAFVAWKGVLLGDK